MAVYTMILAPGCKTTKDNNSLYGKAASRERAENKVDIERLNTELGKRGVKARKQKLVDILQKSKTNLYVLENQQLKLASAEERGQLINLTSAVNRENGESKLFIIHEQGEDFALSMSASYKKERIDLISKTHDLSLVSHSSFEQFSRKDLQSTTVNYEITSFALDETDKETLRKRVLAENRELIQFGMTFVRSKPTVSQLFLAVAGLLAASVAVYGVWVIHALATSSTGGPSVLAKVVYETGIYAATALAAGAFIWMCYEVLAGAMDKVKEYYVRPLPSSLL